MAKKRRTKAQKLRAAVHRQEQLAAVSKKTTAPAVKASRQPTVVVETKPKARNFRQLDLRRSLVILGGLLVAQLGLWWLFATTRLDENLYNWIKL